VWLSDLPQDHVRVDEYSDAVFNGNRTRVYRFADGSSRTFYNRGTASGWTEMTKPRDNLSPLFVEPSPDVDTESPE
jgi:hypothetical protein